MTLMKSLAKAGKAGLNISSQSHEECIEYSVLILSNCATVSKSATVLTVP